MKKQNQSDRIIYWLIIFIGILFFLLATQSCVTLRLERKLSPEFRNWYDLHSQLMNGKTPAWIEEDSPSERVHFLRLPPEMKRKYIKYFWRIRKEGADELFYSRVEYANENFNEGIIGWRTDRGRVFILCGVPDFVQYYHYGEFTVSPGMPDPYHVQVWMYYHRNYYARYVFQFTTSMGWRRAYNSSIEYGDQTQLEQHWRDVFSVTEKGWLAWGAVLLDFVHGKEKKK